jgi:hypothetical protein
MISYAGCPGCIENAERISDPIRRQRKHTFVYYHDSDFAVRYRLAVAVFYNNTYLRFATRH